MCFSKKKFPHLNFFFLNWKKNIQSYYSLIFIGMIEGDGLWSCTYENFDGSFLTIFHDTWTKTHVQILSWSNQLLNFIQIVEDPIWM
jgi:hypothetical protein